MFYVESLALILRRLLSPVQFLVLVASFFATTLVCSAQQFSYSRELDTPETVSVSVRNRDGRITVIAAEDLQQKARIEASSSGAAVADSDITAKASGKNLEVDVRQRGEQDRIDVVVRVPVRSKVEIESRSGEVSVIGNVESALVKTDTGTFHADVPLDALKYDFIWEASRPRYMSDVELKEVKEKAGGWFRLSGKLGEDKPKKEERVALNFHTQRGVVLLNVDPAMAPSDLRERPLTEAARAIVRSGDAQLTEAIRKVSPKMFGDYARTLPPLEKEPTLHKGSPRR